MSGVAVIRYLLAHNTPVLAVVPAARITAGDLPVNTVLPAIAVTQVSSVPLNLLRTNEANKMHTDRVQASVLFKGAGEGTGYPGLKAMMKLVLAACPSQRGTVGGVMVDSIVPELEGPDLSDPANAIYSQSRDFLVRWIAT